MEQAKTKFVKKPSYLYVLSSIEEYSKRKEFWLQQKRAKKPAGRDPYDFETNAYFGRTVRSAIYDYPTQEQERAAGHLAWDIAKKYGWGSFGENARWIIKGFADLLSEQEWQKLDNYLNGKKQNNNKTDKKDIISKEMTLLQKMNPTEENVLKYANLLFDLSSYDKDDCSLSTDSLYEMLKKNADISGLNNEQTAMFGVQEQERRISKELVKKVVGAYAKHSEESIYSDEFNTNFMGKMSDMVAGIIKDYKYSTKDMLELKKVAHLSGETFERQWGPEVTKRCKTAHSGIRFRGRRTGHGSMHD